MLRLFVLRGEVLLSAPLASRSPRAVSVAGSTILRRRRDWAFRWGEAARGATADGGGG